MTKTDIILEIDLALDMQRDVQLDTVIAAESGQIAWQA
jgi:hypothetical protein